MLIRYDNLFLPADNLEKAHDYYGNVLGLKLKFNFSDKGMIAYNVGKEEPAIILKDTTTHPSVMPCIWFEVEDVNSEYKSLLTKGVKFLSEPYPIGTGMAAEFNDPFGNRLGITDYSK